MHHSTLLAAAAALGLVLTAAPASAESTPATTTVAISVAGLDPASPADLRRLQRRIAGATETVCGSYAGASTSEEYEIKRCRRDVARMVAPQLARALAAPAADYAASRAR
jgi:UrcA family protein